MAPLVRRMHLFEINDQDWFPPYFREKVQAALTVAWVLKVPFFQKSSPAQLVAKQLSKTLRGSVSEYVFIDFCSGAGGPTPKIEQHLNEEIAAAKTSPVNHASAGEPVKFVLSDLHPHVESWRQAAESSPNLTYIAESVDASNMPERVFTEYKNAGKKILRLFSLAFHHFDDAKAKEILEDTLKTSHGFAIFELQMRDFVSFLTCCVFGLGIVLLAPYYAWVWNSLLALVFVYCIPIIPFVLVVDGWVSALRTRTPAELEELLRSCDGYDGEGEDPRWEIRHGKEEFFWPVGYLHYFIAVKK